MPKCPKTLAQKNYGASKLLNNPQSHLQVKKLKAGDAWKKVDLADHGNDGMSIEVLFDDGSTIKFGYATNYINETRQHEYLGTSKR